MCGHRLGEHSSVVPMGLNRPLYIFERWGDSALPAEVKHVDCFFWAAQSVGPVQRKIKGK